MNVLGIDPGASGGLAIVNSKTLKIIRGTRMPTYKIQPGISKGSKFYDIISPGGIMAFADNVKIDTAVIEAVASRPEQSAQSGFQFGRVTGGVEAMAHMIAKDLVWVSPQRWKSHYHLSINKAESIMVAKANFKETYTWKFKKDEGIAEAALMALWFIDNLKGHD